MLMLPTISHLRLRRHRLSSKKLTLISPVQRGEIRFPRQARQPRDRPAHPSPPSRRQPPGTVKINPRRPTPPISPQRNLSSRLRLCHPVMRRRRFQCRVTKTSSQWMTKNHVNELHARVESPCQTKLPATFKHSRILQYPHPNRVQRTYHVPKNLPILLKNPLNPLRLPSRNLHVLHHRLVPHLARQPTRMFLPKIALRTTIHHSSHFLRPRSIGSLRHKGIPSIIQP